MNSLKSVWQNSYNWNCPTIQCYILEQDPQHQSPVGVVVMTTKDVEEASWESTGEQQHLPLLRAWSLESQKPKRQISAGQNLISVRDVDQTRSNVFALGSSSKLLQCPASTRAIIIFSVQEETVNIGTVFSGRNIKQTVNCAGPVNFCANFQMRCASVVFPRKLDRQRRRLCLITRSIDNQHWLSINLVRLRSKHSDIANKGRQNVLRWRQRNS